MKRNLVATLAITITLLFAASAFAQQVDPNLQAQLNAEAQARRDYYNYISSQEASNNKQVYIQEGLGAVVQIGSIFLNRKARQEEAENESKQINNRHTEQMYNVKANVALQAKALDTQVDSLAVQAQTQICMAKIQAGQQTGPECVFNKASRPGILSITNLTRLAVVVEIPGRPAIQVESRIPYRENFSTFERFRTNLVKVQSGMYAIFMIATADGKCSTPVELTMDPSAAPDAPFEITNDDVSRCSGSGRPTAARKQK